MTTMTYAAISEEVWITSSINEIKKENNAKVLWKVLDLSKKLYAIKVELSVYRKFEKVMKEKGVEFFPIRDFTN